MNAGREKDKYLKARSSEHVRRHFAEANQQFKVHNAINESKTLGVNTYDVISQLRRTRASDAGPTLKEAAAKSTTQHSFMKGVY